MDLKPGNLLWEPHCCNLVLVDFGMALQMQEDGTPAKHIQPFSAVTCSYRPPELWKKKMCNTVNCWPVDVWSFGVTMIEIYSSTMLLPGKEHKQIFAGLQQWIRGWHNKTGHQLLVAVPKHLRNVAWFCCSPEPPSRPKMQADVAAWALTLARCPMKCYQCSKRHNDCWLDRTVCASMLS